MDADITKSKKTYRNKEGLRRNSTAWQYMSVDGTRGGNCRFCGCPPREHSGHASQPHFFVRVRKMAQSTHMREYTPGKAKLLRKVAISDRAQFDTLFCKRCAKRLDTEQVVCFKTDLAIGEILQKGGKDYYGTNSDLRRLG